MDQTAGDATRRGRLQRPTPPDLSWDYSGLPTPRMYGHAAVRRLGRNEQGRDLVVGDIHGQRETFERLLEKVGYSPENGDRLLLLGDLIDRGPDSAGMLDWLRRDGVECVRGNHEQLMLDALDGSEDGKELWWDWRNGGQWAERQDQGLLDEWQAAAKALPFALEVDTVRGPLVLVHAEIPQETPWWAFKAWLEEGDRRARILALWARERFCNAAEEDSGVPDVWRAFHGHTPLRSPRRLGNIRWIDLGAAHPSKLPGAAVACVAIGPDGEEAEVQLVRVLDVDPRQVVPPGRLPF